MIQCEIFGPPFPFLIITTKIFTIGCKKLGEPCVISVFREHTMRCAIAIWTVVGRESLVMILKPTRRRKACPADDADVSLSSSAQYEVLDIELSSEVSNLLIHTSSDGC